MKSGKIIFTISFFTLFILLFLNCERDDSGSTSQFRDVTGHAQKGPFINGSSVTVFDLREDLTATGKSYNAQITDNKGTFELKNVELSSNYASLRADGFYFNEVSGEQSAAQITLYALADISGREDINVNLLTHLEKSRVEYLMTKGESFSSAKSKAQKEILAIFNMEKAGIKNSEELDISGAGEDNGILLAISAILQGYRQESQLTELLSNIINDITEDGQLDDASIGSALINHAINLDTIGIRSNLVERYAEIGAASEIPPFEKYISDFISKTTFVVTESQIEYPATGLYGDNILVSADTLFSSENHTSYSLAANLQKGTALKIKITAMGSENPETPVDSIGQQDTIKGHWYYGMGTSLNWSITLFDFNTYTQTFTCHQFRCFL